MTTTIDSKLMTMYLACLPRPRLRNAMYPGGKNHGPQQVLAKSPLSLGNLVYRLVYM